MINYRMTNYRINSQQIKNQQINNQTINQPINTQPINSQQARKYSPCAWPENSSIPIMGKNMDSSMVESGAGEEILQVFSGSGPARW